MSLVIRNLQRVIPVRRAPLRKNMEIVRTILGKNVPTDVLSFPFHEMYGQEKLVLEELSRHTGTGLQPLSRGLY
uniref:endoribonuclease YbeY-like isoform X2 n=1 Tax=Jaculus jaculus TaxID=51337 RepID=UPI001E1AF799|nr:endoribonuclease YbeY-like isoform X2 [Jaculus jaculus]